VAKIAVGRAVCEASELQPPPHAFGRERNLRLAEGSLNTIQAFFRVRQTQRAGYDANLPVSLADEMIRCVGRALSIRNYNGVTIPIAWSPIDANSGDTLGAPGNMLSTAGMTRSPAGRNERRSLRYVTSF
jgi:hypothetical protein